MSSFPPISTSLSLDRSIAQSRDTLSDLQRQLASGKRSTTYGGLGLERTGALSMRSELAQVEGYRNGIGQADLRIDVMLQSIGRIRTLAADTRSSSLEVGFDLGANGQTLYQSEAAVRFDEMVSLLNSNIGDRYLFGGRDTEGRPVSAANLILDGGGGRAGFRQLAEERNQADLGADGLGRLELDVTDETVTVGEDVDGSPFGFKLAAAASTLSGTTLTGPAGAPPAIEVEFSATLPQDGETLAMTLDLPDGTKTDVVLTARNGAAGSGEFQIGADEDETAANFHAAVSGAVEREAATTLRAASTYAAADDFFDFDQDDPPQRVDGPPFDTATGLTDATADDTVFWYQGEVSDAPARQSAVAKADDEVVVGYGSRADEEAFRTTLKTLAVATVETYDEAEESDPDRYAAMRSRAAGNLSFAGGAQSVADIETEVTTAKVALGRADERHEANVNLMQGVVDDIENADIYEVSAQILALQTRLEASLHVTVAMNRLSLVNFL